MRKAYIVNDNDELCPIKYEKDGKTVKSGGHPHIKSRILYPEEILAMIKVLEGMGKSAKDDLTNFKFCLLSGARFEENRWIQAHPECFDKEGRNVKIRTKKVKVEEKERHIRLSNMAINEIGHFFNVDKRLPTLAAWDKKLRKLAELAGLDEGSKGVSSRMMRKTYESWLFYYFKGSDMAILGSQGHNETTALKHYAKIPFIEKDRELMKEFVEGWI